MRSCMIAYSEFYYDARIKSYVNILNSAGHFVDLIIIADKENIVSLNKQKDYGTNRLYFVSEKYRGNSQIAYIFSYVIFFIKALLKVTSLFFREKYKLIHVHNMPNFLVFSAIIPKLFGAKVVLDIHDLMIPIYLTKFSNKAIIKFFETFLKFEQAISLRFVDHIICADHLQGNALIEEYKVNPSKLTVLMNIPNENIFKILKIPRASDNFNLIYHGTMSRRLGIDLLLHAINNIKDKIPVKLHLYGSGEYLIDIINTRKSMGLEDFVYIHGKGVPAEQLSEIICSMDAGIIGNRYSIATNNYMMPVKLMEYVYHKIPVVAPRLNIIKYYFSEEMVKYYDAENVEQMCDCIIDLYRNPEERKVIINNANRFFVKYNSHAIAMEYLNLINYI